DWKVERPALGVVSKLKPRRHLSAEEFTYLRGRTTRIAKVTLPSPTLFINFWSAERAGHAYATLEAYLEDVVAILRNEVTELVRLGGTYIQLDAPHYTSLLDRRTRAFYETQGWSFEGWLARGVELENAVMKGFPEVTFGFHL
ncbi:MAG: methionine synthase, partial [Acidobacteriota bacterium]